MERPDDDTYRPFRRPRIRRYHDTRGAPPRPAAGLYVPGFEHDACGIALVADLHGRPSHGLVRQGIVALEHLAHRGATGSEEDSGDGAGILIQVPHEFLAAVAGFDLPGPGGYAVGIAFLPQDGSEAEKAQLAVERLADEEGLSVLGWRDVPFDDSMLGSVARAVMPRMRQVFVAPAPGTSLIGDDPVLAIDRLAFVLRKRAEHEIEGIYLASLSARTITYKGMLTSHQLAEFYPDLSDERLVSGLALVHSRFPPTRSRRGRWPTPTGTWLTTARSTPWPGTATGCAPVRRSWHPT